MWVRVLSEPGAERSALRVLVERAARQHGRLTRLCPHCGATTHGRPRIAGRPDLHVSVGYADGLAVLVVAEAPVGVDVEADGPAPEGFPDRAAWTRTEAALKLAGTGLRADPWDAELVGAEVVPLTDLPPGYVGAMASYAGKGGSSAS